MKNAVLWVVKPCGSCRSRRFGIMNVLPKCRFFQESHGVTPHKAEFFNTFHQFPNYSAQVNL
jgi:hypothetical protein